MLTSRQASYLAALYLAVAGVQAEKTACGSLFVAFGYGGANDIWCYPYVDNDMQRYLAWYNGSTTITLTGNPDECPDATQGPVSNALGIGGMFVDGNSTLDRREYDTNPFYFWMPYEKGQDISLKFQSSTDYYIEETQSWKLEAAKSGDGYDVTGYWTGTLPTDNYYYYSSSKCWEGGDQWPSVGSDGGEEWHWNITGRLTPESATWKFDQTWITEDGIEWHVIINFEGNAYTDGPRLVTTEAAPTTEGVLGASKEASSTNDDPSSTASGSESSATSTSTSTSTSSSSTGSSTNSGFKAMADWNGMVILVVLAAGFASFL